MRKRQKSGQGTESCPDNDRAARIAEIENLRCQIVKPTHSITQKEAEKKVRLFSPIKNIRDGRIAEIPIGTIGKILRHKGYDISQIFNDIPELFRNSLLAFTDTNVEGKPNIKAYHHYIGKFSDDTGNYFIRFTLHELKVKPGNTGKNYIHSTAISGIDIYRKDDDPHWHRVIDPGKLNTPSFNDSILEDFFNSVK